MIDVTKNVTELQTWESLFTESERPYYDVAGTVYYNKLEAIFATKQISRRTGRSPWEILKFNFFNSLSACDFSVEPTLSYNELCKQRALQLRDKYKYIRLYYSGGVDSHTTLRSFHEAGVPIDEIVIINNSTVGAMAPSNVETTFLVIPSIPKIKQWFPKAKINVLDYVFDVAIDNNIDSTEWQSRLKKMIPGWHVVRNPSSAFDLDPNLIKTFDKDSHCELVGEPKPSIVKKNGQWYSYQIDNQIEGVLALPNLELFHCSSDFPSLFIKQCHMLKRGFETMMVGKPDSYSLTLNRDYNQKNIFLERCNEWDVNMYSKQHNEWAKKLNANGELAGMDLHHQVLSNDTYFSDYYKKFTEIYKKEIYEPYAEFFNQGKHWKGTRGMLSLFWGLNESKNYNTDQLWPNGFGTY